MRKKTGGPAVATFPNSGLPARMHQYVQRGTTSTSGDAVVFQRSWLPPSAYELERSRNLGMLEQPKTGADSEGSS
jgi:hypothetical protein